MYTFGLRRTKEHFDHSRTWHDPDELPPARLYFDDLEEIVKVFNECGSAVIQEPKVKFLVGRVECTELEELKTFGERTSKLEIEVSRDNELVGAK